MFLEVCMSNDKSNTRFPYVATLVAFLAIVIMLSLGFWQLDRKVQKEARLASVEIAKQSASIDLAEAFSDTLNYQDYVVSTEGKVLNKYFYIDNKLVNSKPGFYVLVPFSTNFGVVMVNLGWLPATGVRSDLPNFTLPSMDNVQGLLYLPLNNSLISETNNQYGEYPVLLQQVDLDEISKHLNIDILPGVLRLLPSDSEFVREWKAVTMSPDKHLGYAVQWFGLAIAALTVYLLSMLKWLHGPQPTGSINNTNNKNGN